VVPDTWAFVVPMQRRKGHCGVRRGLPPAASVGSLQVVQQVADQDGGRYEALRPPQILAVWAAAAVPMCVFAWIVAPWLRDQIEGDEPLAQALLNCLGHEWPRAGMRYRGGSPGTRRPGRVGGRTC
jgi:hypothetical protein